LVFACIAFLEGLPLVTRDTSFDQYQKDIEIINPERVWNGWRSERRDGASNRARATERGG
jgi:hypothetical protein